MRQERENWVKALSGEEPSDGFTDRVIARIALGERRARRARLVVFGMLSSFFVIGLVPAFLYMENEIMASTFYTYLSLLFSDGWIVMASWEDFIFSLIESAPISGMALFLGCFGAFLWTARIAARSMKGGYDGRLHSLKTS